MFRKRKAPSAAKDSTAIALALEGAPVPRPLTHDLIRTIFETLEARLEQVVIHDIRESTFFAKLVVRKNGELQEVDTRPSDGIALALRMSAPIYVSDKIVLEESISSEKTGEADIEKFKKMCGTVDGHSVLLKWRSTK